MPQQFNRELEILERASADVSTFCKTKRERDLLDGKGDKPISTFTAPIMKAIKGKRNLTIGDLRDIGFRYIPTLSPRGFRYHLYIVINELIQMNFLARIKLGYYQVI